MRAIKILLSLFTLTILTSAYPLSRQICLNKIEIKKNEEISQDDRVLSKRERSGIESEEKINLPIRRNHEEECYNIEVSDLDQQSTEEDDSSKEILKEQNAVVEDVTEEDGIYLVDPERNESENDQKILDISNAQKMNEFSRIVRFLEMKLKKLKNYFIHFKETIDQKFYSEIEKENGKKVYKTGKSYTKEKLLAKTARLNSKIGNVLKSKEWEIMNERVNTDEKLSELMKKMNLVIHEVYELLKDPIFESEVNDENYIENLNLNENVDEESNSEFTLEKKGLSQIQKGTIWAAGIFDGKEPLYSSLADEAKKSEKVKERKKNVMKEEREMKNLKGEEEESPQDFGLSGLTHDKLSKLTIKKLLLKIKMENLLNETKWEVTSLSQMDQNFNKVKKLKLPNVPELKELLNEIQTLINNPLEDLQIKNLKCENLECITQTGNQELITRLTSNLNESTRIELSKLEQKVVNVIQESEHLEEVDDPDDENFVKVIRPQPISMNKIKNATENDLYRIVSTVYPQLPIPQIHFHYPLLIQPDVGVKAEEKKTLDFLKTNSYIPASESQLNNQFLPFNYPNYAQPVQQQPSLLLYSLFNAQQNNLNNLYPNDVTLAQLFNLLNIPQGNSLTNSYSYVQPQPFAQNAFDLVNYENGNNLNPMNLTMMSQPQMSVTPNLQLVGLLGGNGISINQQPINLNQQSIIWNTPLV